MSNLWFHIIVCKRIIVQEKEKKIIKTNHFTTIWSVVKEAIRKNISTFKKIRYFNCGKYLVIRCSHQGAHVCLILR